MVDQLDREQLILRAAPGPPDPPHVRLLAAPTAEGGPADQRPAALARCLLRRHRGLAARGASLGGCSKAPPSRCASRSTTSEIEASSQYADARPHADLFITTLPSLDLEITSAYLGSGDFDWIPATHKVADPELGNMVEHDRLEVTAPLGPPPRLHGAAAL